MRYQSESKSCLALKLVSLYCFALLIFFASPITQASDRFALIIGNNLYQHAPALKNPVNDARDVEQALRDLDFDTRILENTRLADITQAVESFVLDLERTGGVGLFYYAGHGMQINGENYLLPVETRVDLDFEAQGYNIARLLDGLRRVKASTKIIILDACRDNPFSSAQLSDQAAGDQTRALKRKDAPKIATGLSKLDAPADTLIAFSTSPGKTATDGAGRNSPYTENLVKTLKRQGLSIDKVFRTIREDVVDVTDGRQVPWESSSLINDFYFNPRKSMPMGF